MDRFSIFFNWADFLTYVHNPKNTFCKILDFFLNIFCPRLDIENLKKNVYFRILWIIFLNFKIN